MSQLNKNKLIDMARFNDYNATIACNNCASNRLQLLLLFRESQEHCFFFFYRIPIIQNYYSMCNTHHSHIHYWHTIDIIASQKPWYLLSKFNMFPLTHIKVCVM